MRFLPQRHKQTAQTSPSLNTTSTFAVRPRSQRLALISWRTSSEENVTGYKVHRTLLDSPEENRWVNRFPIAAMGAGVEYHVIDSQAVPGKTYRYRVYGFDESGRLSLATNLTLAERMQPSCSYVPLVYAAESVPGD